MSEVQIQPSADSEVALGEKRLHCVLGMEWKCKRHSSCTFQVVVMIHIPQSTLLSTDILSSIWVVDYPCPSELDDESAWLIPVITTMVIV